MTLQAKLMLTSVLTLLFPLLLFAIVYLFLFFPVSDAQFEEIDRIPVAVLRAVMGVLDESQHIDQQFVDDNILAIMYGTRGVVYSNPALGREFSIDGRYPIYEGYQELPATSIVGVSRFEYREQRGLVLYFQRITGPLRLLSANNFRGLILVAIFLLIIPAILSWIFLNSLRKTLKGLEKAANSIASGVLDNGLEIPTDPAISSVFQAFEYMRSQLNDATSYRHRFLLAISHDLKSPLTSILGYIEAMEDGMAKSPEEQNRYLSIIRKKSDLLQDRISELVQFSQMETGQWKRKFAPLEPLPLLKELCQMFEAECRLHGRSFEHTLEFESSVRVMGDPTMLYRAFENLLENARRYTPEGATIRLSACVQGQDGCYGIGDGPNGAGMFSKRQVELGDEAEFLPQLIVSVEDSGPGITPVERQKVFEHFYRGEGARSSPGTGLGLTSVSSIIQSHGGTVELGSSELGGAKFVLSLELCIE